MNIALQDIVAHWLGVFRPPPRMTVSEWADRFRYLSAEASSNPGKYSSSMTPYAVEWMDSVNDPGRERDRAHGRLTARQNRGAE
jgi:phage terminase large subunit GpA-like protein